MKARLIANPKAGGGAILKILQELNEILLPWNGHVDICLTTKAGDARQAAREAAENGYVRIFTAGGDGTINECVNGVGEIEGALERVHFGILPLGTGNDFARTMGLPADALEAVTHLQDERVEQVDLGRLDDHYFVNVSAGGFIAEVSGSLSPALKAVTGKLAYFISGMQALVQSDDRSVQISVEGTEDARWSQEVLVFAVANGTGAGGGKPVAPAALINDGLLDLLTIEPMPVTDLVGLIPQLVGSAPLTDARVRRRQCRKIEMRFDGPITVNTDGEPFEVRSCRYEVCPAAAYFFRGRELFNGPPP